MTDFDEIDFFVGDDLVADPYPYFEHLRAQCPVRWEPHHDVVMVTGYQEAIAVFHDTAAFSSCNSVTGPFPGFPVPLVGDDVSALIAEHRDELPMSDQLPTLDPPTHTDHRALLMRLITPKRLKENEAFMWRLADRQIDEFLANGECEFISEFASPFAMLVIADLLGVPESDHEMFRAQLAARRPGQAVGSSRQSMGHNPLEFLYARFGEYVEDRREHPADDVLTGLATATFPDGSLPEIIDVVRIAANLFAAGQETTVRLLANALLLLGEQRELQQLLRSEHTRIPNFVEEVLRFESPVKGDFRLSRVPTTVGGVDIPAGTTVMVLTGAANRDPRRFERADEFRPDRANAREHIAFGHGVHTCPGAPLARAEGRISIERLLDRLADIEISEADHGPRDARRYRYAPTYILRGLTELHLEFTGSAS
jgi:cytochrome P450 family 150 subfamily A5